jgi:prepilin-type N-terminal cleavage/methylation domain-containing protein
MPTRFDPWPSQPKRADLTVAGFSLLEVLVALTLLSVTVLGLTQLFAYAARAERQGRALTAASVLASQKLDQLRSLTFAYDAAGARVTDVSTDTATVPESPAGGLGLTASTLASLETNTRGYCDFLDATGRHLGAGPTPPSGTAFVRRWALAALPDDPLDSLLIHVRVVSRGDADSRRVDPASVTFSTLRTRTMW